MSVACNFAAGNTNMARALHTPTKHFETMIHPRHESISFQASQICSFPRRLAVISVVYLLFYANSESVVVSAQEPFECGATFPGTVLKVAGSWVVRPIAELWKASYLQTCPDAGVVDIERGGNDDAISRLCSATLPSVDIAMLSRPVRDMEAEVKLDGITYTCNIGDTTREFVQLDVALDGLAITTLRGSDSDLCIQQIGGLSRDQLRWMFSSYSESQLLSSGWDPAAIPNSDGDPTTHLWCELLAHPSCLCNEIRIAGSVDGTQPHQYFGQFTFEDYDNGETFDQSKYFASDNYFDIIQYLDDTGDAIAYVRVPIFERNNQVLSSAPILADFGIFIPPNGSTLQTGDYPYSRRVFMNIIASNAVSYRSSQPFIRFGYSSLGLALVSAAGLVPIPEDEVPELLTRISAPPVLCFSGQNTVIVRGKGTVALSELRLHDYVLVQDNAYSEVISFGHFLPNDVGEFLQIQTQATQIEISPLHLLRINGSLHPAAHVKVGDMLGNDTVISLSMISSRGIYAPITESGFIAVSGVVSSSYVQLWDIEPNLMHTVSHWALAPMRICKRLSLPICSGEAYNEIGIAKQYMIAMEAIGWITDANFIVQAIAVLLSLPVLLIARLLENVMCVLQAALVGVSILLLARQRVKSKLT